MRIVFNKIFGASPQSYVREKVERAFRRQADLGAELSDEVVNQKVASVVNHHLGASVPIALPEAFYEITAEQEAEIEARKRCVLATLLRESPLLEGEAVNEDFFTFLQGPFESLQADTAVLKRTTNMAEIYYLFDDVQVVAGDLRFIEPAPVPYTTEVAARQTLMSAVAAKPITATSIAKKLGSGLVDGIAGTIGGLIFEAIFPPGVPDYFDEVYKEIRNIVKQEVTSASIDNINGRVNGIVAWQKNTYKPRKASGDVPRKDLLDMITPQVDGLYKEAVYTLMEERYAKPGLPAFMVAAGVHLALMQEQALVDPLRPEPAKSSFATSVKLNAQTYCDHIVSTFNAIVADREKAVEIRYDPLVDQDPGSPYLQTKARYRWLDTITQRQGNLHEQYVDKDKKNHSGREEAEADRRNYLPGIINQLSNNLDDPRGTANLLLKLTTKPIPSR